MAQKKAARKKNLREIPAGNWWRDKPLMEKVITILPIIIGLLSVIYVGLTYRYTVSWNERQSNIGSYSEPLNCQVEWNVEPPYTEDALQETVAMPGMIKLPAKYFVVSAKSGKILNVRPLYYYKGRYFGCIEPESDPTEDKDREDNSADYWALENTTLTLYAYEKAGSSEKAAWNGESYYTSIFLVVDGYNGERKVIPAVFEYMINESGNVSEHDCDIRQYSDIDVLHLENVDPQIPDFDLQVLKDYKEIIKILAI